MKIYNRKKAYLLELPVIRRECIQTPEQLP